MNRLLAYFVLLCLGCACFGALCGCKCEEPPPLADDAPTVESSSEAAQKCADAAASVSEHIDQYNRSIAENTAAVKEQNELLTKMVNHLVEVAKSNNELKQKADGLEKKAAELKAAPTSKYQLLYFTQPGCIPCAILEHDAFPGVKAAGWKIEDSEDFAHYGVTRTPTIVVRDAKAGSYHKFVAGGLSAAGVLAKINESIAILERN